MIPSNPRDNERVLLGALVAGILGGLALAVFMALINIASGHDLWLVMKGPAAPFIGARATVPGFDGWAIGLGLVCHFGVSIAWAIPFVLLVDGLTRSATVIGGIFWGVLVWVAMFYIVLPIIGLWRIARGAPVGIAILEHVTYGVFLGLGYLPFQRTRPRKAFRAV